MKNLFCKIVIGYLFSIFLANIIIAQHFHFQSRPKDTTQVELKFLRPNFHHDADLSTFSGVYELSFNIHFRSNVNIYASIPYGSFKYGNSETYTSIYNLYIGVQLTPKKDSLNKSMNRSTSIGIFLPTAPEEELSPILSGLFTDLHNLYKYSPNTLSIYGNISYRKNNPEGMIYGFEIGPTLYIPTKDTEYRDGELYLHYGITGGIQFKDITILSELVGIVILTEDVDEFSDRFAHSLAFGLQLTIGKIKPTVFYSIYLEEEQRDIIDGVLGIKLEGHLY